MEKDNPLDGQMASLNYIEELYRTFQANPKEPKEFDPSWILFFEEIEKESFPSPPLPFSVLPSTPSSREEKIARLADMYRKYGHRLANLNPLAKQPLSEFPKLNLLRLGFDPSDKETLFPTLGLLPKKEASLKEVEALLKRRYCQTIGFEYKEYTSPAIEEWMQQEIEKGRFDISFSSEEKKKILTLLTEAEGFETFFQMKYVGKKRFSLEGGESLIPMLAWLIAQAAEEGTEEMVIGMSHRGRLNVLANILSKPLSFIFNDFNDDYEPMPDEGKGDICYHKGYVNEAVTTYKGQTIKLSVTSNPSHLESINPVVEGQVHAQQFLVGDEKERKQIIPLLMHGDASFAGQGVVYETLQMSRLSGFETGGTLHFIINNQIGFTTTPNEGRSTHYSTDIAHTFGIPVLHVNGEDPEICIQAALFALDLRQRFQTDVFIDFNCYRKYGHNEGDEPSFTQPLDYQIIRKKKTIRSLYAERLILEGVIEKNVEEEMIEGVKNRLSKAHTAAQTEKKERLETVEKTEIESIVNTAVPVSLLEEIAEQFSNIPSGFHLHPKIAHLIQERTKTIREDQPLDWGTAEYLTYGTLCMEEIPVRLAGEDSGRGTFSHRHALWIDQQTGCPYSPLANLHSKQARFEVLNTCLSEVATLGFEYGYSTVCKNGLTVWEAQFGDFINSAQVIIDQYLVSAEEKWGQTSNLVLLLPHGFEGQGPEHSSGRLERFLSLAAQDNIRIAIPTLPAQLFHLLRKQAKHPCRKPLIVFTPKGLLRHPSSISCILDLTQGSFYPILNDPRTPQQAHRLVLCAGRIYFDLDHYREKEKKEGLAIIRLEQLYPLDSKELKKQIASYPLIKECLWVQEEPYNMGAWSFISSHLSNMLPSHVPLHYVGRDASATTATGFPAKHKQELRQILQEVFER